MTDAPADPAHNIQFTPVPDPANTYMRCVMYDPATGEIIQWDMTMQVSIFVDPQFNTAERPLAAGVGHPDTHWVDPIAGVVMPRLDMGLVSTGDTLVSDGVDSVVVSNIPDGSVATIGPQSVTVTGGSLAITTTEQGQLTVRVKPPTISLRETTLTLQAT